VTDVLLRLLRISYMYNDNLPGLQPSSRQYENAAKVTSKAHRKNPIMATLALKHVNVPVFHAPGLVVTRSNGEVSCCGLCLACALGSAHCFLVRCLRGSR
jgi:hypothetical protein